MAGQHPTHPILRDRNAESSISLRPVWARDMVRQSSGLLIRIGVCPFHVDLTYTGDMTDRSDDLERRVAALRAAFPDVAKGYYPHPAVEYAITHPLPLITLDDLWGPPRPSPGK